MYVYRPQIIGTLFFRLVCTLAFVLSSFLFCSFFAFLLILSYAYCHSVPIFGSLMLYAVPFSNCLNFDCTIGNINVENMSHRVLCSILVTALTWIWIFVEYCFYLFLIWLTFKVHLVPLNSDYVTLIGSWSFLRFSLCFFCNNWPLFLFARMINPTVSIA